MHFNYRFYKSFDFWVGIILTITNRDIFWRVDLSNPFWYINVILFISGVYGLIAGLIIKQDRKKENQTVKHS
ncbi:hypothetical protein GPK34_08735 [Secundilactobacillus kimchicus]|uniref:Integral membrane protein n=1 Tax=Secundilactobacillus kimchicus JCM 15530 TaxID=1302272 RepID=A0A0R1HSY1_9LACO|nr:hypothetical protein [Secundilactobacillus kimchicus]KRK48665.1 hypothetical protein FC96_GL000981 [Secundilactobacillus kimchicus JCM 15530]MBT9672114.1 hypothetical protein [Secundilactobacillus kimchicus]